MIMESLNNTQLIISRLNDLMQLVQGEHRQNLQEIINYYMRMDLDGNKKDVDNINPTPQELLLIQKRFRTLVRSRVLKIGVIPDSEKLLGDWDVYRDNIGHYTLIDEVKYYDDYLGHIINEAQTKYYDSEDQFNADFDKIPLLFKLDIGYIKRKIYLQRYAAVRKQWVGDCKFRRDAMSHIHDIMYHEFEMKHIDDINKLITKLKEDYETTKQQITSIIRIRTDGQIRQQRN